MWDQNNLPLEQSGVRATLREHERWLIKEFHKHRLQAIQAGLTEAEAIEEALVSVVALSSPSKGAFP